jgi:PAS domain S-box-containing protein
MRPKGAKVVDELLALLDWLPASVALWDSDVRLRYGNNRALTRFGRTPQELLGAHLSDLVQAHAVELSAQYIDGALAGVPQQVERAMVDEDGQRYNAHQVTHIPNVVGAAVQGYCALAVDITASIEGYQQARRAREQAASRAVRDRIVGDITDQHVVDDLSDALERLDVALDRAADALPSLNVVADSIDRTIDELRAMVPARMIEEPDTDGPAVAFPAMAGPDYAAIYEPSPGVPWPPDITGRGWSAEDICNLLDMLPAEVAVWDLSLRNEFANRAALRWFGHPDRDSVAGVHASELLGPELFEAANVAYAEAALLGQPQQFDRTVTHRTGLRHLQVYYAPRVRGGEVDGIYSCVVDVTHRVDAELALQDARAELASARERGRIADHLHNLVIQRLFAAGLAATLAVPGVADAQVRSVQDGIIGALEDLESAITTLHEQVGLLDLLPELAHLVHDEVAGCGITATIENVGSVEYVPPSVVAELLAVARAAVANVARHSGALNVAVTIAADVDGVWLRVADDGRGFGPERADDMSDDEQGKGMADMLARADRLGGTCAWRGNTPSGTLVDWRVPTHPAVRGAG